MIKITKKTNNGFTLIEMIVAMFVVAIITVPMMTMIFIGTVTVERQSSTTIQSKISRETLQLVVDDLEKYASLSTRVEKVGDNITKLVILNDDTLPSGTVPKKVMYVYDNDKKVLLRIIDAVQSVVLSEEQLGERYYKEKDLEKYNGVSPVIFVRDNVLNTVSVYLRVKIEQEALPQENRYIYNLREEDRKVINGTQNGVIWVNEEETFNFRNQSFSLETYFKFDEKHKDNDKCIFNLTDEHGSSKIKLHINGQYIRLMLDNEEVITTNIIAETNKWQKVVVIYDDIKKNIKTYLTDTANKDQLTLKDTISYDTTNLFYNTSKETVPITNVYIANTGKDATEGFTGYLYEPRIWKKVVDIYKDVNSSKKYDYTKKLTGLEQGLIVYIKDDYRRKETTVADRYNVDYEIKNEVNNKVMGYKDLKVYEEVQTYTNLDNISELIGY